jgi:hypothetical protein
MSYEDLIATLTEIVNNDIIVKENLTLVYRLSSENHRKMNEHLFYQFNDDKEAVFEPMDEFEVEIEGVMVKFINSTK